MTALASISDSDPICREIEFCGEQLVIDPSGCLYWPDEKLLVVSDLHFEKGNSIARKGRTFVPPYDTSATLERLRAVAEFWNPRTIVSLGDSFHDEEVAKNLSASHQRTLTKIMDGREWVWIYGNHDPKLPDHLDGVHSNHLQIGNLNFVHEPRMDYLSGEIAGHLHPAAKIKQRGKSIRRRCVIGNDTRLILPAFGQFTGGLNAKNAAFNELFNPAKVQIWMLSQNNVFEISARQLVK